MCQKCVKLYGKCCRLNKQNILKILPGSKITNTRSQQIRAVFVMEIFTLKLEIIRVEG
jgi:hypothetical protein